MSATVVGRHRGDVRLGDLPDDPQPGDYWRYVGSDGQAIDTSSHPENLTGGMWGICPPNGSIGTLAKHTVRENDDGTITVAAGDGSSNSIHHDPAGPHDWHGYIDHGVWRHV